MMLPISIGQIDSMQFDTSELDTFPDVTARQTTHWGEVIQARCECLVNSSRA